MIRWTQSDMVFSQVFIRDVAFLLTTLQITGPAVLDKTFVRSRFKNYRIAVLGSEEFFYGDTGCQAKHIQSNTWVNIPSAIFRLVATVAAGVVAAFVLGFYLSHYLSFIRLQRSKMSLVWFLHCPCLLFSFFTLSFFHFLNPSSSAALVSFLLLCCVECEISIIFCVFSGPLLLFLLHHTASTRQDREKHPVEREKKERDDRERKWRRVKFLAFCMHPWQQQKRTESSPFESSRMDHHDRSCRSYHLILG